DWYGHIPDPVFEHRRVGALAPRPSNGAYHVHHTGHTTGGDEEPGPSERRPRGGENAGHQQHGAEMQDGGRAECRHAERAAGSDLGHQRDHHELQACKRRGGGPGDEIEILPRGEMSGDCWFHGDALSLCVTVKRMLPCDATCDHSREGARSRHDARESHDERALLLLADESPWTLTSSS